MSASPGPSVPLALITAFGLKQGYLIGFLLLRAFHYSYLFYHCSKVVVRLLQFPQRLLHSLGFREVLRVPSTLPRYINLLQRLALSSLSRPMPSRLQVAAKVFRPFIATAPLTTVKTCCHFLYLTLSFILLLTLNLLPQNSYLLFVTPVLCYSSHGNFVVVFLTPQPYLPLHYQSCYLSSRGSPA